MIVSAENISKSFGDLNVIRDFNIEFNSEGINCIFGPSGCGKTTLINILSGLMPPDSGSVTKPTGKSISYVFQEHRLIPWVNVEENVKFVMSQKREKTKTDTMIEKVLDLVELDKFRYLMPHELSGGMKQRASIARAFAFESDIMVLDEPFKGLNFELKKKLMDYIIDYREKTGCLIFFITHEIDEVIYMGNYIYVFGGLPLLLKEILEIGIPFNDRHKDEESINNIKSVLRGL